MYRPPPLRGLSPLDGKKVLLIDEKQATRDTRANVLRSHGVEVDTADTLQAAWVLWRPHRYDLILLNLRQQFPGEALEFYEQVRDASRGQRFAFLVGAACLPLAQLAPGHHRGYFAGAMGRDGEALREGCISRFRVARAKNLFCQFRPRQSGFTIAGA